MRVAAGFKNAIANYRVQLRHDTDVSTAMLEVGCKVERIASRLLDVHGQLKFGVELFVDFIKHHEDETVSCTKSFINNQRVITLSSDFSEIFAEMC